MDFSIRKFKYSNNTIGNSFSVLWFYVFLYQLIEEDKPNFKYPVILMVLGVFFGLSSVFIPSKQDLYVIYGVGGTIDYIKENPTAQQIPDKLIKRIDKYLDIDSIK